MSEMGYYSIRVLLVFIFTYFATRILSKKAIAEMTAYEVAGIILLSTVAAEPLVTKVTTKAIYGTGLLVGLIVLTSRLALINGFTQILEHTPTILVKNGQVDMKALSNTSLSLNEFYGLLRSKGYSTVSDVEFAILEPQGKISVIPKSQKRPIQPSDLSLSTKYEGLTLPLIMDGKLIEPNLEHVSLTKDWLMGELKKQNIIDYKQQVAIAELDTTGTVIITRMDG